MSDTGIFHVAISDQFVAESAQSVRDVMPDIPVATDVDPDFDLDHVIDIDDPDYSFADQISNFYRSLFV